MSYYLKLQTAHGECTLWGAMVESATAVKVGDTVSIENQASRPVTVKVNRTGFRGCLLVSFLESGGASVSEEPAAARACSGVSGLRHLAAPLDRVHRRLGVRMRIAQHAPVTFAHRTDGPQARQRGLALGRGSNQPGV